MYLITTIIFKQIPIIQDAIKQPNSALSRPTPRSGRRVSLKRDVLAQAGPLRLGEGSKEEPGANAGSRLGESLLAWARCSLAQKLSRSLGRPFAQKGLGESLFVSPRRDWLAWASLPGLVTVLL